MNIFVCREEKPELFANKCSGGRRQQQTRWPTAVDNSFARDSSQEQLGLGPLVDSTRSETADTSATPLARIAAESTSKAAVDLNPGAYIVSESSPCC